MESRRVGQYDVCAIHVGCEVRCDMARVTYTASVQSIGGRSGEVKALDGTLTLSLAEPPTHDSASTAGTNPEQLFAAGFAACFESTIRAIAQRQGTEVGSSAVLATVDLVKGGNGFELAVRLEVDLPGIELHIAEALVDAAEERCPYARAVRGNVPVEIVLHTERAVGNEEMA